MAQTKRKRKRKHRGTPAGTIERSARSGSPSGTRKDAKQVSRERRLERLDREPTWRGAINRAAIAAVVFGVLMVLLFERSIGQAAPVIVFMFLLYIPLGYATDRGLHRFRQRRRK